MEFINNVVAVIATAFGFAPDVASDAPFGLEMGHQPSEYGCTAGTLTGFYVCDTAPKPHSMMSFYTVQSTPETGICFVKGVTRDQPDSGFGSSTRELVDTLAAQIATSYGKHHAHRDFVVPDSMWQESQYWMRGVQQRDRWYYYEWEARGDKLLKSHVRSVWVGAGATTGRDGFAGVEFTYANEDACVGQLNQDSSNAF